MFRPIVKEKEMLIVSENQTTGAAIPFKFAAENAIVASFVDVAEFLKVLATDEKLMAEFNKKMKATSGIYFDVKIKDVAADVK